MAQKHVCLSQHLHSVGQHLAVSRFVSRLEQHFIYFIIFDVVVRGGGGGRPGLIDIKAHTHSHRCVPHINTYMHAAMS